MDVPDIVIPSRARTERVTVPSLRQLKETGEKIVFVTAYDFPSARLADRAGVDAILVGDSVMLALGYDTTVPVTMEDMLHHTKAARRGVRRALLVADMPFGTYQTNSDDAMRGAFRLLKEGGAQAVKIEGGAHMVSTVRRMTESGIPVMGHLGLTPQSVNVFGGHRVQGRDRTSADQIREDALALQQAGAFAIVLETIPAELAATISRDLSIPTVGIGAGPDCDGQVQVWYDILGIYPGKGYKHVRQYAQAGELIENALRAYTDEVKQGSFPTEQNSFPS